MSNRCFQNWLNNIEDEYVKVDIHGGTAYLFGAYVQLLLGFPHNPDNKYYFGEEEIDVLTFASIKKTYKVPYTRFISDEGKTTYRILDIENV